MQRTRNAFPDTRSLIRYSTRFIRGAVLDLGAGQAKYKPIIKEACSAYTAVDIVSSPSIDVVCDIEHTPFPDGTFNALYCTQVLEHVRRPWLVAEEIARLLAPDGVAIISVPFLEGYHADPDDYFRYTVRGLESLFSMEGLECVESGTYGSFWSVCVDAIRKIFFSGYEKPKPFSWRFNRLLIRLGHFLDRLTRDNIVYMDAYIIVRKRAITM